MLKHVVQGKMSMLDKTSEVQLHLYQHLWSMFFGMGQMAVHHLANATCYQCAASSDLAWLSLLFALCLICVCLLFLP